MPTAPRNLNYIDLTGTGVTLTWRRPDPPNGVITQYNVSDITNNYYNVYCHRYLILVQTHKLKLLMISLFSQ